MAEQIETAITHIFRIIGLDFLNAFVFASSLTVQLKREQVVRETYSQVFSTDVGT